MSIATPTCYYRGAHLLDKDVSTCMSITSAMIVSLVPFPRRVQAQREAIASARFAIRDPSLAPSSTAVPPETLCVSLHYIVATSYDVPKGSLHPGTRILEFIAFHVIDMLINNLRTREGTTRLNMLCFIQFVTPQKQKRFLDFLLYSSSCTSSLRDVIDRNTSPSVVELIE